MEPSVQCPWSNGTAIVREPAGDRGPERAIIEVAHVLGDEE